MKWFINCFRKKWHPFFLPLESFKIPLSPACCIHNECSLKGTQIPESVTFLLAKSGIGKFLLVESGILGFRIWKSAEGVRNPTDSLLIYGAIWEKTVPGVSLFKKKTLTSEMFTTVLGLKTTATLVNYTCKTFIKLNPV